MVSAGVNLFLMCICNIQLLEVMSGVDVRFIVSGTMYHVHWLLHVVYSLQIWILPAQTEILTEEFHVQPGEAIRLNCSTEPSSSVDWHYQKKQTGNRASIYIGSSQGGGGSMAIGYRACTRHQIDVHSSSGRFDLVITNVEKSDEGIYICSDASNTDVIEKIKLTVLAEEIIHCSTEVAARVGDEVLLSFPATKRHSIQLEHRSIGASYPVHVFRDGRIINDYYVNDGRFRFNISHESWNLVIERVQLKDAGIYICTEDNGLGQQYRKELVVIEEYGVSCNTTVWCPRCIRTCNANFYGNCPPRLEIQQREDYGKGRPKSINKVTNITIEASTVTAVLLQDYPSHGTGNLCTVTSNFSYINYVCHFQECTERTENGRENLEYLAFTLAIFLLPVGLLIYRIYGRHKALRTRSPVQTHEEEQLSDKTKNIC